MTTRARELAARIMPYCQWLHDGTEWYLRPEAEAEIETALLAAEDAALERAANVIKRGKKPSGQRDLILVQELMEMSLGCLMSPPSVRSSVSQ